MALALGRRRLPTSRLKGTMLLVYRFTQAWAVAMTTRCCPRICGGFEHDQSAFPQVRSNGTPRLHCRKSGRAVRKHVALRRNNPFRHDPSQGGGGVRQRSRSNELFRRPSVHQKCGSSPARIVRFAISPCLHLFIACTIRSAAYSG